jgi:hypothetical protein
MFISNIIYNSYVCANWNALKKKKKKKKHAMAQSLPP